MKAVTVARNSSGRAFKYSFRMFEVITLLAMIWAVGLAINQNDNEKPRPDLYLSCELKGQTVFKATVFVQEEADELSFLKTSSDEGLVCRLFNTPTPVK